MSRIFDNYLHSDFTRKFFSLVVCSTYLLVIFINVFHSNTSAVSVSNPIVIENSKIGTAGWENRPISLNREVDGFTSESSYTTSDTINFHISTENGARYRTEIYRLGWYNGDGARLMTCLPSCSTDETASLKNGNLNSQTGEVSTSSWGAPEQTLVIPNDWVTGYYMAIVELTAGSNAGMTAQLPFILREANPQAPILIQAATTTWHAYNSWGGASSYTASPRAVHVNFDRPIYYGVNSTPLAYDMQLVRFAEREGYNVAYTTGIDTHRNPSNLLNYNVIVSNGHDEYWSTEQFDAFENARDYGVNIMFMTANAVYWHVRYENNERRMVVYKDEPGESVPSGEQPTKRFRHIGRPECQLIGVQYNTLTRNGEYSFLDYHVESSALSDPWFTDTGIQAGDSFPNIVGYEWDEIVDGCPVPVEPTVIFSNTDTPSEFAHSTKYQDPESGAVVFATGSMAFAFALDSYRRGGGVAFNPPDARIQAFVRNVLNDLSNSTGTPPVDTDGDGVPDSSDLCPTEPAVVDTNNDGCEDPEQTNPNVALIAGSVSPPSGDRPTRDAVLNAGWDITIFDDDAIPANDVLDNYTTVVIASSVLPNNIPDRLKDLPNGLVVMEAYVLDDLGLTDGVGEQSSQTVLSITPGNEIAGSYSGATTVSSSVSFGYGNTPAASANIVATLQDGKPAIFTYETNTQDITGSTVAGRRAGFYWSYSAPGKANSVGIELFLNTINWASNGSQEPPEPPPPPPVDTDGDGVPDSSDLCPTEPAVVDTNNDGCEDPEQTNPNVALIAGSVSPPSGDRPTRDAVLNAGWDITIFDDDAIPANDVLDNYTTVVIASSVLPNNIPDRLKDLPNGLVVMEAYVLDDLGLTDGVGEQSSQTVLSITPGNEIAGSYSGATTVSSSVSFGYGNTPAASANIVATLQDGKPAIFTYETNTQDITGSTVAGRRAGFYWSYSAPGKANSVGIELFLNTINWASNGSQEPPEPSAPVITSHPVSISVLENQPASFVMEFEGTEPAVCQWYRDGTIIEGATEESYVLESTSLTDSGSVFSVVVTNSIGSTASNEATLQVDPTPATLAPNASFEANPYGDYFTHGSANFSWASDSANTGYRSAKIEATGSGLTRWISKTNSISIDSSDLYDVSASVRTQAVSGRAELFVTYWNSSQNYVGYAKSRQVVGTESWQSLAIETHNPPSDAVYLRVEMRLTGTGTTWWDDIILTQN